MIFLYKYIYITHAHFHKDFNYNITKMWLLFYNLKQYEVNKNIRGMM